MNKNVVVIPVREGSKGIQDKNWIDFNGKPLMSWTIEQAKKLKKAGKIDRIIMSTDSKIYAVWANSQDIEVYMRSSEISTDESLDITCFQYLDKVLQNEKYFPDMYIHLRVTYPTRQISDILKCIELMKANKKATSVRSVVENKKTVFKQYFKCDDGSIVPCVNTNVDMNNWPRQILDVDYIHNGCIDIVKPETIHKGSMSGDHIIPYEMNDIKDIDTWIQFQEIQFNESFKENPINKTFVFDIDGVICNNVEDCNYYNALPIRTTINLINKLFENNYIILFTARGTLTEIDWSEVTKQQLKKWKVKYHQLKFGKPAANYYIDDKFVNINQLKARIIGNER